MADYQPVNGTDTLPFTKTVGATAVSGGMLVSISGDNLVVPSTAGDHSIGVAAFDAPIGGRVTVWPLSGVVHEVVVQGVLVLAAGNDVIAGTTGFIKAGTLATDAAAGTLLGICTKGATGPAKAQFIGT